MTRKIIKDLPAVAYFDDGNFAVHDGMQFHIEGLMGDFYFGSVVPNAHKGGMTPNQAIHQEARRGFDPFFAYGGGSMITAHKREKKYVRQFNFGDIVHFHGRSFELEPARNGNVKLVEIGAY